MDSQRKSFLSFRLLVALVLSGVLVMGYFLLLAIEHGNLAVEGPLLLEMPWGFLSLVDIYTGLGLVSCWIIWRENNLFISLSWVALILVLGNMGTCIYVLKCLRESKGNSSMFFMGEKVT
jgi:hypothetical protein